MNQPSSRSAHRDCLASLQTVNTKTHMSPNYEDGGHPGVRSNGRYRGPSREPFRDTRHDAWQLCVIEPLWGRPGGDFRNWRCTPDNTSVAERQ